MTDKSKLQALLKQRTSLPQREAVKPVDLYTKPQVNKTTQKRGNKSIQVDKPTKSKVGKSTSKQVNKEVKPLIVKYTTHLDPKIIKAIKILAVTTDKKDYEVVGEALFVCLKGKNKP